LADIPIEELEDVSDSELQTRQTQEDLERKQRDSTNRSLDFLLKQLDAMNKALDQVKSTLKNNAEETIRFINDINEAENENQI
jgi:hypothetical protein